MLLTVDGKGGTRPPRDELEVVLSRGDDALGRLITEMGRAARAGWAPTARLIALLVVAAAAVALVIMTSR